MSFQLILEDREFYADSKYPRFHINWNNLKHSFFTLKVHLQLKRMGWALHHIFHATHIWKTLECREFDGDSEYHRFNVDCKKFTISNSCYKIQDISVDSISSICYFNDWPTFFLFQSGVLNQVVHHFRWWSHSMLDGPNKEQPHHL